MDIDRSTRVFKSPLFLWVRTFVAAELADLTDFVDGYLLNKIMTEIDPAFFGTTFVHSNVNGDVSLRIHNLEHLLRSIKNFYKEKLQQIIIMETPDVFLMANDPESDECIRELKKILLLVLGCAVQCERKEFFVEKITALDESIQQELVIYIREITEKFDKVFSIQPNEIAALSHEDLLSYCEQMHEQMIVLVNQRDSAQQEIHQILVDRSIVSKEISGGISRVSSPPLSPTNSEIIFAEREKLKKVYEELDEKNLLIQELRDELQSNKITIEKLFQENRGLSETSRFVTAYRDQLDILKIKAEKVNKLENEIIKYKEKLMEMDVLKKRKEELEEQNEILYNTKVSLEKQTNVLNSKAEKLVETERELVQFKKDLKNINEENKLLKRKNKDLLDENAVLLLDAQNSFSEVSNLNSELDLMKGKEETTAEGTCLASECIQVSSKQLLKLENENHRLKGIIAELTQHEPVTLLQNVGKGEEALGDVFEQTTEQIDVISEDAEVRVVQRQSSFLAKQVAADSALNVVKEKLRQKEEVNNKISESLSIMEQENSELKDRMQQVLNQKRRNDQIIERKSEDILELERRLEEVTLERQKCETTVRQKTREINELNNSLSEMKEDKERTIEDAEKKAKERHELKERVDLILSEKEKLDDALNTKDKKLVDLENRLLRVQEANKELARTLESQQAKITTQDERVSDLLSLAKITTQDERVSDLLSLAKEDEKRYSDSIREKDRRLKEFERRITHLIEVESELESLNYQLKQKDRKSDGFLKTITEKDEEIVRLENKLEDASNANKKLVHNLELRDKKVETLEERLSNESEKQESNNVKATREILESKDNKILELESRLEDALTNCKKLEHTLKVKEEKIMSFESRLEEASVYELECNKLKNAIDERKKVVARLESSLDEMSSDNHKLSCDLQLKDTKTKELEEKIRTLEAEKQEIELVQKALKEKDEYATTLGEKLKKCMEELAVLENRIEETSSQNGKLQHSVKMKDERIVNLESKVLELEDMTNYNKKLKQMIEQKEEKIRLMERKMDHYEDANRQCERLTEKSSKQDEHITKLNNRISVLEEYEKENRTVKFKLTQKDERITYLEQRLQETQLKSSNLENEVTKMQGKYEEKVKRSLEDVDTHKIRRIESVRRREEQIKSLEKSRSKLETVLHAQEGHIHSLQDRLENLMSERNQLGTSLSKKESIINEMQKKVMELEDNFCDVDKLNDLMKKKDDTIKRFEDRVREVEMVLNRTQASNREKDTKIDLLKKRIDECLEQNKKLEEKLKKRDEALRKAEEDMLDVENRNRSSPGLSTDMNKLQSIKQKLWDAEARIEEIDNEKGKVEYQLKRKESYLQDLEVRLRESSDALDENERLKQNIKHKEERLRILQASLDQNLSEINSLESRLENMTSEVYKLRKVDGEKQKRINSFKMKLEEKDKIDNDGILRQKNERIHTLEEKNKRLLEEKNMASERMAELETKLNKGDKAPDNTVTMIDNISYDRRPHVARVSMENEKNLDMRYKDVEKEFENLRLDKEHAEGRYSSLREENKNLSHELKALKSEHDHLLNDLNEMKESYTDLDLLSAKSLHRCEMLTQMNNTLEEENRMLMEQMNKLLTQNQELLTESLVSRDQFLEEERTFSDRLYELQRQKEKLEEKIEQANRSLAENTPKKKSNLFKKVLQKAGLKKKKEDGLKSKSAVQLIKYDQSPRTSVEGSSDVSDSSPGMRHLFSMSPERASDSSNISESIKSDISFENDLSPSARKKARLNRANRQQRVKSEYLTSVLMDNLAIQGRSRSLDPKEFNDLVFAAKSDFSSGQVSSCSSMTVLNANSDESSGDSVRGRNSSNDVSRILSFSLVHDETKRPSPIRDRRNVENRTRNPPEYNSKENVKNSPHLQKIRGVAKGEAGNRMKIKDFPLRNEKGTVSIENKVKDSPHLQEIDGGFKVEAGNKGIANIENKVKDPPQLQKTNGGFKVEAGNRMTIEGFPASEKKVNVDVERKVKDSPNLRKISGGFKVEAGNRMTIEGFPAGEKKGHVDVERKVKDSPNLQKISGGFKVEAGNRMTSEGFPAIEKKGTVDVERKIKDSPNLQKISGSGKVEGGNWITVRNGSVEPEIVHRDKKIKNNFEKSPKAVTEKEKSSSLIKNFTASNTWEEKKSNTNNKMDSTNKNLDSAQLPLSLEHRSSTLSQNGFDKSTYRRFSESSSSSRPPSFTENEVKRTTVHLVSSKLATVDDGKNLVDNRELKHTSSIISDHVPKERTINVPSKSTLFPSRTVDTSNISSKVTHRTDKLSADKQQTKRTSSFIIRPQSPLTSRNQVHRQHSDRIVTSSMEIERKKSSLGEPAVPVATKNKRPQSYCQRSDSIQSARQSSGMVSHKEVASVQSAALESNPRIERKEGIDQPDKKGSSFKGDEYKVKTRRGQQTPLSSRQTSKVDNLEPKNDKNLEKQGKPSLWYEYGQV